MKKLNILLAGLVALGLASCDDKSDMGVMQTNPQEAIMEANGLTVDFGAGIEGQSLSLPQYAEKTVPVIKTVEVKDLPADASVSYIMQVSADEKFSKVEELKVADGAVSADAWDEAFIKLIGKTPETHTMWVRFAAYITSSADKVRLGGPDFYYAEKNISVTPYDLNLPVEAKYYLIVDGAAPVEMAHSEKHQYDDPTFTYIVEGKAEGTTWMVVPESALNGSQADYYGVSSVGDPAATDGALALMGEGAQAGVITAVGPQKLSVNMLDLSYSVKFASENLYTPGGANGWGFNDNMLLWTWDYSLYRGFVYVDSEFKLTAGPNWDLNWGGKDGALAVNGENFKVSTNGLYWVAANLTEMTYELTQITTVGMIGGFNDWGADEVMTTTDFKTYVGTLTTTGETQFKFRFNGDWAINLGGSADELTLDAGNLTIPEAGTYEVTLKLGSLPYSCTILKK